MFLGALVRLRRRERSRPTAERARSGGSRWGAHAACASPGRSTPSRLISLPEFELALVGDAPRRTAKPMAEVSRIAGCQLLYGADRP